MRNIITIITVFFVMSATIAFTYNDAEARSSRKSEVCTCQHGTLTKKCAKHGNACTYQSAHEHENNTRRNLSLPLYCEANGQSFLVYAPSCKQVKKQVSDSQRRMTAQQRAEQRYQQNYQRNIQRGMNNIPFVSDFQREIRNENRRIQNQARNNIRREIRDTVRGWYGR